MKQRQHPGNKPMRATGAAILLFAAAFASPAIAADSVFREIVSVTIYHQGAIDPSTSGGISCKHFTLTQDQAKRFLTRAKEVDSRTYTQDLDFGACYVEGTLTLKNGLTGNWQIRDTRIARVTYSDQHVMLLNCPRCKGPFAD